MKNSSSIIMMFFIAGSLHFLSSQNTPKSKKGQVYFFLSPECPLCISYVPILNSLYDYKLLYKGKIDNWVVSPGKKRARATEFYLKDAITHYLNNDSIIIKSTPAIGCFIE